MNKIQFFYDDDLIALEQKINDWLAANKVKIIETNLNSLGKPSQRAGIVNTEKYVFYILYTAAAREPIAMQQKAQETISAGEQITAKIGANLTN